MSNELIDVDQALGHEFPPSTSSYDKRDLALYALGVGAATDPLDSSDLQLVYEQHAAGFRALPTYGVIPAVSFAFNLIKQGQQAPGLHYGLDRVLHGEQFLELARPLPTAATLTHKARIKEIWDKGKGALVITEVASFDADGAFLMRNELTVFVRGAGGWGGDRGPREPVNVPPERNPDLATTQSIRPDQALLYRLTGDLNPLHADPAFAQAFGFDRPILHGLCTLGFSARHVLDACCDGDPRYFKSIKVRFADSVFPGETLRTDMWRAPDNRVLFQTRVLERDKIVISNAAVELHAAIPASTDKAAQP